jgi:hypothetical protein
MCGLPAAGIILAVVIAGCTGLQSASGASISVREDGTTRTLTCDQTRVLVSGHHNSVTLNGSCSDVSVPGDDNHVSIENTAGLSVPGDNNTLSVQRVNTIRLDGHHNHLTVQFGITRSQPTITNDGEGNVVATGGAG